MKIAINTSGVDYGDMDFAEFEKLGETVYFKNVPRKELFEIAKDCDAIIVNKVIIDEEFLEKCPKIKYVGVFATGYNVVDLAACRARGVTVCNAPPRLQRATGLKATTFAITLAPCARFTVKNSGCTALET